MIDIDKLTNQISATINCSVKFGNEDVSPSEYPMVKIIPDNGVDTHRWTRAGMAITINFTLQVIDSRENERRVFDIFFKLMQCINDINFGEGLAIGDGDTLDDTSDTGATEYTENEFKISVPLQYKDIINKES